MRVNFLPRTVAVLSLGLLGLVGCGQDNESVVKQQAATSTATVVPATPQPKTQAEYGQQQSARNSYGKQSGYPGAK